MVVVVVEVAFLSVHSIHPSLQQEHEHKQHSFFGLLPLRHPRRRHLRSLYHQQ
jgi:hypothetical protein